MEIHNLHINKMKNKTNILLTICFGIILITLSIYILIFGTAIFVNTEMTFLLMAAGATFIIINITLGIAIALLCFFNENFKNLKDFIMFLPWITIAMFIFPFIAGGLFNCGPKSLEYINIFSLLAEIVFFIYLVWYYFKYIYGNNFNIQVK